MRINKKIMKKKYSYLRRCFVKVEEKPNRLIIDKAKWLNNVDSPVMLMIDDLANSWYGGNEKKRWVYGGDWGGGLGKKGSAISFLEENLLKHHSDVKVTFFAVAGKINIGIKNNGFTFSGPLNFGNETTAFFRKLNDSDRFEIAYHGYNHGISGARKKDFVQEWEGFKSIEQAIEQINKGKDIFKEVFGKYPSGGKYGGWKYNELADESIDRSRFIWWCRDFMPRDISGKIHDSYYEPRFFGEEFVLAIPSTIHGFHWNKKQIDTLINKKQIISIEEHIASKRPDGLIQTPNIIDDIDELNGLFNYLRNKKVWYATGTEIAEYFLARTYSTIYDIKKDNFKIRYTGKHKEPFLTLLLDFRYNPSMKKLQILTPFNEIVECVQENDSDLYKANVKVMNGVYKVLIK